MKFIPCAFIVVDLTGSRITPSKFGPCYTILPFILCGGLQHSPKRLAITNDRGGSGEPPAMYGVSSPATKWLAAGSPTGTVQLYGMSGDDFQTTVL